MVRKAHVTVDTVDTNPTHLEMLAVAAMARPSGQSASCVSSLA